MLDTTSRTPTRTSTCAGLTPAANSQNLSVGTSSGSSTAYRSIASQLAVAPCDSSTVEAFSELSASDPAIEFEPPSGISGVLVESIPKTFHENGDLNLELLLDDDFMNYSFSDE